MHTHAMAEQLKEASLRLLENHLEQLMDESTRQLLELEPSYRQIGDKTLTDQMRKNISLTLLKVSGSPIPETLALAAYETGQLRAIQQVDLPAVSRSFRIDLRVLWQAFLEDAKEQGLDTHSTYISELLRVWEAVESNINEMTEGYRVTSEKLKQQNNELKVAAFQRLLSLGASSNYSALAKQLSTLSFNPSEPLVCVVSDIRESDYALVSLTQTRLTQQHVTHHFGWNNQYLVGILQGRELDQQTLRALLAEFQEFRTAYTDVTDPRKLGDSIRNTRLLVSAVTAPGTYALRDNWLITIAQAEPTLIDALVDDIFQPFEELTDYVRDELERVIQAFFSTNGTIAEIAQATYRHRNTIRSRLLQIEDLTGLSLDVPRDVALLALSFQSWKKQSRRRRPETKKPATPARAGFTPG